MPEPLAALPMADGSPAPPVSLGAAGRELRDHAWSDGLRRLSQDSDWSIVQLAGMQTDVVAMAHETYAATRDSRDLRALNQTVHELVHMLSLMGFTPVDRSRLGVSEVKALSKVDEIRRRAARREQPAP